MDAWKEPTDFNPKIFNDIPHWRPGRYQLVQVGGPDSGSLGLWLPGRKVLIEKADLMNRDAVVLAEQSAGRTAFCDWIKAELAAETELVHVRGRSVGLGPDPLDHAPALDEDMRNLIKDLLGLGGGGYQSGQTSRRLEDLNDKSSVLLVLIIRDVSWLNPELVDDLCASLRSYREMHEASLALPKLRFIFLSSSEDPFAKAGPRSSYLDLVNVFGLFSYSAREIVAIARARGLSMPVPQPESLSLAESIWRLTGGQPLLVREFLSRLKRVYEGISGPVARSRINQVARSMKEAPPSTVRRWQLDLAEFLETKPEHKKSLLAYATGHSRGEAEFPAPALDHPLFSRGWLGPSETGRWGMRSDLHRFYAESVLRGESAGEMAAQEEKP